MARLGRAFAARQVVEQQHKRESVVKNAIIVGLHILLAAGAGACASMATAQTPATTRVADPVPAGVSAPSAPLELQLPPVEQHTSRPFGGADSPGVYYGDHGDHDEGADDAQDPYAAQVHGSFTTGIGYSKGFGTSTMNAAELNVSKQYDDGKRVDVHIHLEQGKGPGFYPYGGYYGPRYRGY